MAPEEAPSVDALEALYESVEEKASADKTAQKYADALLSLDTPSPSDTTQAVEAITVLKKTLEDSIDARTGFVTALRGLLAHQKEAAQKLEGTIKATAIKTEAAQGVKKKLREAGAAEESDVPAAKKAKIEAPVDGEYEP